MMRQGGITLVLFVVGVTAFLMSVNFRDGARAGYTDPQAAIVLPPVLQVLLYGGDPYLAADIETVRAVASLGTGDPDEALFRLRAHETVSRLNACHEDNYWIGNAALTWGGSQDLGLRLLKRAMDCRFWDQWPAFFYGFNQQFFNRNIPEAAQALETAATRADEKNAAGFRRFAVMLQAGQFADVRMAITFVEREQERASDPRLREMLALRVKRLRGLASLRDAQAEFEKKMGRPPVDASELVKFGVLDALPVDPLGIGYTWINGEFHLQQRTNPALEGLR